MFLSFKDRDTPFSTTFSQLLINLPRGSRDLNAGPGVRGGGGRSLRS